MIPRVVADLNTLTLAGPVDDGAVGSYAPGPTQHSQQHIKRDNTHLRGHEAVLGTWDGLGLRRLFVNGITPAVSHTRVPEQ